MDPNETSYNGSGAGSSGGPNTADGPTTAGGPDRAGVEEHHMTDTSDVEDFSRMGTNLPVPADGMSKDRPGIINVVSRQPSKKKRTHQEASQESTEGTRRPDDGKYMLLPSMVQNMKVEME